MIDWSRRRVLGSLGAIAAPAAFGFGAGLVARSLPAAGGGSGPTPGPYTPAGLTGLPDPALEWHGFSSLEMELRYGGADLQRLIGHARHLSAGYFAEPLDLEALLSRPYDDLRPCRLRP